MNIGVGHDHALIIAHIIKIFLIKMMKTGFKKVDWLTQSHIASLLQAWKYNPDLLILKIMFPAKHAGYKLPMEQRC